MIVKLLLLFSLLYGSVSYSEECVIESLEDFGKCHQHYDYKGEDNPEFVTRIINENLIKLTYKDQKKTYLW